MNTQRRMSTLRRNSFQKVYAVHRMLTPLALAALSCTLPGCIVRDIHNELVSINQRLDRNAEQLKILQERLEALDRMASIDESLQSVDGSLKSVDSSLASVDAQLDTIESSLSRLDEHLASLRKTINNIDSTIPFLRISGDDEQEKEDLESSGDGAQPNSPPADQDAGGSR